MFFLWIVAPDVTVLTQKQSPQSDTCSSRYLQNTETCTTDTKEASIMSNLLLICFHPSAPFSTNPSSNHILCKRSFTDHFPDKVIWSFGLFPLLRIYQQTSFVKLSFILRQHPSSILDPTLLILCLLDTSRICRYGLHTNSSPGS